MAQNYVGNALAQIGQIRQQRTQNALADRQIGLQEAQGRRAQQQFDTEQATAQRAQLVETTKNVLGALARVPQAQRQAAFAQLAGDLPPEFAQRMAGNPEAFTDQNIALALNRFGALTPDQIFSDKRRETQATTAPKALMTRGPDGRPMNRAFDVFGPELAAGVVDSPDAAAIMNDQRVRSEGAASRAVTIRGQNLADARAREASSAQREALSRPVEMTDPTTGQPILVQYDRQGRPRRVDGLLPKGANADVPALRAAVENADAQIAIVDQALNHPGREATTGLSGAFPTMPGSEAANFEAVLEQIRGAAFLQAFQSLKGGGAITEQEGRKAEAAIARLQTSQSDEAFAASLRDLRRVLENGKKRAAARLGPAARNTPATPQSALPVVDWNDL